MDVTDPTATISPSPYLLLEFQLPSGGDPSLWAAVGVGALAVLYVAVVRPALRRRDPTDGAGPRAGLARQRAVERDMSALLVEYEEMIRQMTAGVDTRAARLEALIREADERLAALRAVPADGARSAATAAERRFDPEEPARGV